MRTFRESERYGEHASGLGMSVKRLDEILAGAIFVACKDPELFPEVPDTGLRCIVTDPFGEDVPAIRIYFAVSGEDYIDAIEVEVIPDPDEPLN